ncbi:hypothetical protein F5X97DRAFT_274210 [Nemania serpens]|nr:hypothetical protein F5X97DRAFT_274210 [Nemania serpens]
MRYNYWSDCVSAGRWHFTYWIVVVGGHGRSTRDDRAPRCIYIDTRHYELQSYRKPNGNPSKQALEPYPVQPFQPFQTHLDTSRGIFFTRRLLVVSLFSSSIAGVSILRVAGLLCTLTLRLEFGYYTHYISFQPCRGRKGAFDTRKHGSMEGVRYTLVSVFSNFLFFLPLSIPHHVPFSIGFGFLYHVSRLFRLGAHSDS